ncbi:MAG TPA: hypothetical protein VGA22_03235 [Gemmatimonadales bacterium]
MLGYVVLYFLILLLVPKRWLPQEGTRAEWRVLVGVGLLTLLVVVWPMLLWIVALIWLGELVWHRLRGDRTTMPAVNEGGKEPEGAE